MIPNKEDSRFWGVEINKDGIRSIPFFHDVYESELEAIIAEQDEKIKVEVENNDKLSAIIVEQDEQIKQLKGQLEGYKQELK